MIFLYLKFSKITNGKKSEYQNSEEKSIFEALLKIKIRTFFSNLLDPSL